MISRVAISGVKSRVDSNKHQITLTVECEADDSIAVIKILHDTIYQLGAFDPTLDVGGMKILKDLDHIHPMVVPPKEGEKPN